MDTDKHIFWYSRQQQNQNVFENVYVAREMRLFADLFTSQSLVFFSSAASHYALSHYMILY